MRADTCAHDFYQCRAEITKRLIAECGFVAVAVEADWPDAYRAHQFAVHESNDASANEALSDFARFPQWMWRNTDVLEFVEWLRAHNETKALAVERAGLFGLDLYSMHTSITAVIRYLDSVDSGAATRARNRYSCFDHFGSEPQRYGYATSMGALPSCEQEALDQLIEMHRTGASGKHFSAEQNARLVSNAERYYRMMFAEGEHAWTRNTPSPSRSIDQRDGEFSYLPQ